MPRESANAESDASVMLMPRARSGCVTPVKMAVSLSYASSALMS